METKRETAVKWLFDKLWDTPKDKFNWYALLQQSKDIEKEKMKDVFEYGYWRGNNDDELDFEQFWNIYNGN